MLTDPTHPGKDVVFTVVTRSDQLGRAIRTQRWRYTAWPEGEELYDLQSDPAENTNLVEYPQHSETLDDMRARLRRVEARASAAKR